MRRRVAFIAVLSVSCAACADRAAPGAAAPRGSSTTAVAMAGAAPLAEASMSEPSVAQMAVAPAPVPDTSAPVAVERDCIQGHWAMGPESIDEMLTSIEPGWRAVAGSLSLVFALDGVTSTGRYTMQVTTPDGVFEADVDYSGTGTYVITDGVVTMRWDSFVSGMSTARAVPDEGGVEVPEPLTIAGGPAVCTDTTLRFTTTSDGANEIVMVFERATG